MNCNLIKCLPVLVLALGVSACSKQDAKKSTNEGSPAVSAATVATSFEADCGGAPASAVSANSAFDLSGCQLNSNQLNLLQEVGPFKVEADCARQAVLIKNAAEQISGSGAINADGTYAISLSVGARFSELEGCPVKLEGLATGKVVCDENKKVTHVDVNTTFTLAHVAAEGSALSLEMTNDERAPGGPTAPASGPRTEQVPGPIPGGPLPGGPLPGGPLPGGPLPGGPLPLPLPGPGTQGPIPVPVGKGGQIGKGGIVPPVVPPIGKGGQIGKGLPVPPPIMKGGQLPLPVPAPLPGTQAGPIVPPVIGKGGPVLPPVGKGGPLVPPIKGGVLEHGHSVPARVNACVTFSPCGFSTNASLSCGR